jgi:hypothetical protein
LMVAIMEANIVQYRGHVKDHGSVRFGYATCPRSSRRPTR